MKKLVFGAWATLGILAVTATGAWAHRRATAPTAVAKPGAVAPRIAAHGVIEAEDGVAEVRARTSGRVLRVLVREGDAVVAGQVLAELDAGDLEAEVARREAEARAMSASARSVAAGARPEEASALEADARAARAEWEAAQEEADRDAALAKDGAVATAVKDASARRAAAARARADALAARVRLAHAGGRADDVSTASERALAAEASVRAAKRDLAEATLVAPIAGVVLARYADPGDTVSVVAGAPVLFEVADAARTDVRVEVEENDSARVAVGLAATATGPGGEVVGKGHVVRVGARCEKRTIGADPAAVRADGLVRAAWVAWDDGARPTAASAPVGERVEVTLELPPQRVAALLPRSAVRVENGAAVVQVRRGLFATDKQVELGVASDEAVEVIGLAPGETVALTR